MGDAFGPRPIAFGDRAQKVSVLAGYGTIASTLRAVTSAIQQDRSRRTASAAVSTVDPRRLPCRAQSSTRDSRSS